MKLWIAIFVAAIVAGSPAFAAAQDEWDDTSTGVDTSARDQGAPVGLAGSALGLGVAGNLSGNAGPEIEYWLSDELLITTGFAIGFNSPPQDMVDGSFLLSLSGGAFYRLGTGDRTVLLGGGRVVLEVDSAGGFDSATGEQEAVIDFAIELPLRAEVFLSRALSIHFETGIAIRLNGENNTSMFNLLSDTTVISIGTNSGLFGGAGVTLYWP